MITKCPVCGYLQCDDEPPHNCDYQKGRKDSRAIWWRVEAIVGLIMMALLASIGWVVAFFLAGVIASNTANMQMMRRFAEPLADNEYKRQGIIFPKEYNQIDIPGKHFALKDK